MAKRLVNELLVPDRFIKECGLKEVTNPIMFTKDAQPSDDGLLSNEIFGITKNDRSNRFAYISLNKYFMHPLLYKHWKSMDKNIEHILNGTKTFSLDSNGYIIEDENGKTGLDFIRKNIKDIKIRKTDSIKRDKKIELIMKNKDKLFFNNFIVIPAYYRDIESGSMRNGIGVGEINKMYTALLKSAIGLKDAADYGLFLSHSIESRIQNIILDIYNWFIAEPQLGKKRGVYKRAVQSKTSDYASRFVIVAPSIDAEHYDELMVNVKRSGVPLSSLCANLYPFMISNIRRFLENEYGSGYAPVLDEKTNEVVSKPIKDFYEQFSDDVIKKRLDNFIYGYSNRIQLFELEMEDGTKKKVKFKGKYVEPSKVNDADSGIAFPNRSLTWLDIIFMAAVESAKNKHILITRYPLEDYFGQFPSEIAVASTIDTEPVIVNGEVYKWYPKIREEDIGSDTSNKFVDALLISNVHLKSICGDYDGDQVTIKASFTIESNDELKNHINSKMHFMTISGENIRVSGNEAIQSLYSLTKILDKEKISEPVF